MRACPRPTAGGAIAARRIARPRVTEQWLYDFWRAAGSNAEEARITAEHLVGANRAGHDSHGVSVVPGYVRSLTAGELQLNRRIAIVTDAASLLVVDGNRVPAASSLVVAAG